MRVVFIYIALLSFSIRSFCGIFLASIFCSSWAHAQSMPPPRYSFALAFDDARCKLVLFGGFNKGEFMNDTWEWDGIKWEIKSQQGPEPRNSPAMVYDSKRKNIILFGGDAGNWNNKKMFSDTWEWNGSQWKLLSNEGPTARSNHTLAYDKRRDKIVLFGGMDSQKTLGDLWEWDGITWKQIVSLGGPSARFLHASTYDEKNNKILLFGGNTLVGPPNQESIKGDLWAWDGNKWEQCLSEAKAPSSRDHMDMVYDASKMEVIVHGGGMADGNSAKDTWAWDGKNWSTRLTNSNVPFEGYKMVYDSKNEAVLLFGGFVGGTPSSSLWKLSANQWTLIK